MSRIVTADVSLDIDFFGDKRFIKKTVIKEIEKEKETEIPPKKEEEKKEPEIPPKKKE